MKLTILQYICLAMLLIGLGTLYVIGVTHIPLLDVINVTYMLSSMMGAFGFLILKKLGA